MLRNHIISVLTESAAISAIYQIAFAQKLCNNLVTKLVELRVFLDFNGSFVDVGIIAFVPGYAAVMCASLFIFPPFHFSQFNRDFAEKLNFLHSTQTNFK